MKKQKKSDRVKIRSILKEFEASEKSPSQRRGAFKIDAPFEEAMDKILKGKPDGKKPRKTK